jgi:pheromone shutdown-related protein TraB
MTSSDTFTNDQLPVSGPHARVRLGNTQFTILGTAHVSKVSAEEVKQLIETGVYDAVAVEVCKSRYQAMTEPDQLGRMNLFEVIRAGKAGVVAANLALGAFQQRVAETAGVEPGADMKTAITTAQAAGLPLWLIDRDIGITLRRVYHHVPWWQRSALILGLLQSVISRESVTPESIENLKESDVLSATFSDFAEDSPAIHQALIAERDEFMVLRTLREHQKNPQQHVLMVVGAGHLAGIVRHLERQSEHTSVLPRINELQQIPQRKRWLRYIPWLIAIVILAGFVIGFSRSTELGWQLITSWFLINGTLTAIGTAIAKGHPLTILASFIAAPFTSLNPTIGAGFVAAAVELWARQPTVHDFSTLRHDVAQWQGWWKNRVSRTLLVFLFASLGSMAGTYIGGFRIFGLLSGA